MPAVKRILIFTILLVQGMLRSQPGLNPDFLFTNHLTTSHLNKQAIHLLHFENQAYGRDTTDYFLGYNFHLLKNPDSAVYYFSKVPAKSALHHASLAYWGLNLMYAKKYEPAGNLLQDAAQTPGEAGQLFLVMEAGRKLLLREYGAYDSVASKFAFDNYKYRNEQEYLGLIRTKLSAQKRKSPAVAGLLSAAVPGLGKFYAGRRGAALSAFLSNILLAGFAAESYYRSGPRSAQFITFSSIFACFYAGNIVGSIHSVKQQQRSVTGRINNEILATIHIPVDRLFGR